MIINETTIDDLNGQELEKIIQRHQKEGGILDLSRFRLTDINLDKHELSEIRAQLTTFENCSFAKAKMMSSVFDAIEARAANFSGADLVKTEFHSCNLTESNFKHALLTRTLIINTNLVGADFSHAHLNFASFVDCDLRNARFDNANLDGCEFKGCSTVNASWVGVQPPKPEL